LFLKKKHREENKNSINSRAIKDSLCKNHIYLATVNAGMTANSVFTDAEVRITDDIDYFEKSVLSA
jgi:membrane carboxypeptidase/penicillin-binding protein